ncbi:MAG: hypothetical protein JXR27_09460 [Paludibacteraceae bacterium]|nr:hypothetical protein [Paludibacteraceae bacterium]
MRYKILFFVIAVMSTSCFAQKFDKRLAKKFGADEYGMKSYVLVILKTGETTISDKQQRDSIFAGHMQNIGRMADAGLLVSAGPIAKNERQYRGIYIFDVKTIAEAETLVSTDPAVTSGLLAAEYFSWYASAALPLHNKYHRRIQKKGF